jgi:hypothetical protein
MANDRTSLGGFGLRTLLLVAAIIVFVLAAFGVDIGADVGLVAIGLALFAAAFLV